MGSKPTRVHTNNNCCTATGTMVWPRLLCGVKAQGEHRACLASLQRVLDLPSARNQHIYIASGCDAHEWR
jgi:hypothetical protein